MVEEVLQDCNCLGTPPVRLSLVAPSPCLSENWASKTAGMLVGQASSGWSRIFSFKSCEERKEMSVHQCSILKEPPIEFYEGDLCLDPLNDGLEK